MRGNSQSTRRFHLTNAQRQAIDKEFERRQNVGEDMFQKDLAEWAFKKTAAHHLAEPAHYFYTAQEKITWLRPTRRKSKQKAEIGRDTAPME